MSYNLFVVTKVPDLKDVKSYKTDENPGNMFSPMTEKMFILEPEGEYRKLDMTEMMCLQMPNFRLGEILVLDGSDRDQFGRKPDKWNIEIEYIGALTDPEKFDVLGDLLRKIKSS
jgi:hypothetical protein